MLCRTTGDDRRVRALPFLRADTDVYSLHHSMLLDLLKLAFCV